MLACPALQTSSIISARRMVSKIVAPKSRRLGMRRVLVPFFGGRVFGGSNGGGCRGSDGRPRSGIAGAAAEREQHQCQPDRERECENRRLAAHSHYHCSLYRFHDARPLQHATVDDDDITEMGRVAIAGVSAGRAADKIPGGDQYENGAGAWPDDFTDIARPCRRGDRITPLLLRLLTTGCGTKRTYRDACLLVCFRGEADMPRRRRAYR
jgi:hypothetical protein